MTIQEYRYEFVYIYDVIIKNHLYTYQQLQ